MLSASTFLEMKSSAEEKSVAHCKSEFILFKHGKEMLLVSSDSGNSRLPMQK